MRNAEARKMVVRGSAAIAVGLLSGKMFEYINRLIVARLFNPELFGLYSLAVAVLNLGVVLSSFGFNTAIPRFVAGYEVKGCAEKVNGVLFFSLLMLVPLSLFVSAGIYFGSDLIGRGLFSKADLSPLLRQAAPIIPAGTLLLVGVEYLRGRRKFLYSALYHNTVFRFVFLLTLVYLYLSGNVSMAGVFVGLGAGYVISAAGSLAQAVRTRMPGRADWKRFSMLSYSWPMALTAVFITFAARCDLYVMGYFAAGAEIGYFNACHTLAALILLPQAFINKAVLPVMSGLCGQKDYSVVKDLYESIVLWLAIFSIPVIFVFIQYSQDLIILFFGNRYSFPALPVVAGVLALGNLFGLLAGPNGVLLVSLGQTRLQMAINISSALLGLASAVLLIWRFGIVGAAAAKFIYVLASNLAGIHFIKRWVPVVIISQKMVKTVAGGMISLAGALIAGGFLPHGILAGRMAVTVIFLIVYFILLWKMGFLDRAKLSGILKQCDNRRS